MEVPKLSNNMQSGEITALVSNIQRYTIHDGPGIRTAVFFTGCTLRCLWCSNPETIRPKPQLGVYPQKCLSAQKCGACLSVCPKGNATPIVFDDDGLITAINMTQDCKNCLLCALVCPPRAIKIWGERMTHHELMAIIKRDIDFYRRSGGGVTLSGGEPLLQHEFITRLMCDCKAVGIHTCVETALNCPTEHMKAVFEHTDLVITDIKHMDSEKHKLYTGAGNELILENIKKTAGMGKKLVVRTPVVPGYNDDLVNIRKTGEFLRDELGGKILQYQLLPYRRLGTEKYASLGIPYPLEDFTPPPREVREEHIANLAAMLEREFGLPAVPGAGFKIRPRYM